MPHTEPPPALRVRGDHTWQDLALCRQIDDPDLFFPEGDTDADLARTLEAKQICGLCPASRLCLDTALANNDRWGIRAGMTEEEREPLHRNLPHRLDRARINAALAGRDIYLSGAERHALVRAAHDADLPARRLAQVLKVTDQHAWKLLRRARREARSRALAEQAATPHTTNPAPSGNREAA